MVYTMCRRTVDVLLTGCFIIQKNNVENLSWELVLPNTKLQPVAFDLTQPVNLSGNRNMLFQIFDVCCTFQYKFVINFCMYK